MFMFHRVPATHVLEGDLHNGYCVILLFQQTENILAIIV